MLIADGGGGYGGTDWNATDVRYMWSAIADQETDKHYDVVAGWRQTADLTLTHLGQVQMYRDNLASVWPPAKSPAAAAYLQRLDSLIADLQATHEAASANYTVFATVTLTLSQARHKLKPLLDQYEANEKANLTWKTKQDAQLPDPNEAPKISAPPVSTAQQEALNNQARIIMYDLSSTVISGQSALQKPKPYDPTPGGSKFNDDNPDDLGSGSGFAAPPVIPPPGGAPIANPPTGTPTTGNGVPAHSSTVTPPGPNPSGPANIGNGPILGGVGPGSATPSIPVGTQPPPLSSPTPSPTTPGLIPGLLPPSTSTSSRASRGFTPTTTPGSGNARFGGGLRPGPTGPSGNVIGVNPSNGLIGQIPSNTSAPRGGTASRVNPVGGVIGQPGTPPARDGTLGNRSSGTKVNRAGKLGRPARSEAEAENRIWDPADPWATDVGVDPVVMPPQDPGPIDPGPAIGYRR